MKTTQVSLTELAILGTLATSNSGSVAELTRLVPPPAIGSLLRAVYRLEEAGLVRRVPGVRYRFRATHAGYLVFSGWCPSILWGKAAA